jgi:hypothetical protein
MRGASVELAEADAARHGCGLKRPVLFSDADLDRPDSLGIRHDLNLRRCSIDAQGPDPVADGASAVLRAASKSSVACSLIF